MFMPAGCHFPTYRVFDEGCGVRPRDSGNFGRSSVIVTTGALLAAWVLSGSVGTGILSKAAGQKPKPRRGQQPDIGGSWVSRTSPLGKLPKSRRIALSCA